MESEKSSLQEEMNVVAGLIHQCINENARVALDQAEYQARYNALVHYVTVHGKEDVRFAFKDGTEIKV